MAGERVCVCYPSICLVAAQRGQGDQQRGEFVLACAYCSLATPGSLIFAVRTLAAVSSSELAPQSWNCEGVVFGYSPKFQSNISGMRTKFLRAASAPFSLSSLSVQLCRTVELQDEPCTFSLNVWPVCFRAQAMAQCMHAANILTLNTAGHHCIL